MKRLAFLLALLLSLLATGVAAEARSAPRDMADRLLSAVLPGREPFDLAVRLRGLSAATPRSTPVSAAPLVAGSADTFWILDQRTAQLFQADATLRLVSSNAYWFVQGFIYFGNIYYNIDIVQPDGIEGTTCESG